MSTPPVIDGVIDPKEWAEAVKIDDIRDRVTGQEPAKNPTVVYIGYTKKEIFVAFQCFDDEPEKIVGREVQPNSEFRGEDTVTLNINLFGTRAFDQLNEFIVNSIGTQTERIAGGRSSKREWRGLWKAKTTTQSDGWICEMSIPWSMLNYPNQKLINMDLNFIRRQGRTLFEQSWANYRLNPLPELQGQWMGVQPPPPPTAKPQLLLYSALDSQDGKAEFRNGLDAKYAITSSLSGLVSVAPDFRNVEDVIAGNDFVRVERFLNDPRPFFQEGSNFFDLNERFSYGRMFYSRRIQNFDIGTKVFGLLDPKLAVSAMYTNELTGAKSAVAKVLNTISGTQNQKVFMTKTNLNGVDNTALGMGFFKRWDTIGFSADLATETDAGQKQDTAGVVQFNYIRPTTFIAARYTWVDPDFRPALGFIPWTNRKGFYAVARLNREWREGFFRDYNIFFNTAEFRTYDTREIQEGGYSFNGEISTRSDFGISLQRNVQSFSGAFDDILGMGLTFNKSNRFRRIGVYYENGRRSDTASNYYSIDSTWRVANNLDVGFRQSLLELNGTDRQSIISALWQIKDDTTMSTRIATTPAGTNAYLSFRKAGNAGAEYYVILGDPNALETQARLSLKVVWAF